MFIISWDQSAIYVSRLYFENFTANNFLKFPCNMPLIFDKQVYNLLFLMNQWHQFNPVFRRDSQVESVWEALVYLVSSFHKIKPCRYSLYMVIIFNNYGITNYGGTAMNYYKLVENADLNLVTLQNRIT